MLGIPLLLFSSFHGFSRLFALTHVPCFALKASPSEFFLFQGTSWVLVLSMPVDEVTGAVPAAISQAHLQSPDTSGKRLPRFSQSQPTPSSLSKVLSRYLSNYYTPRAQEQAVGLHQAQQRS